MERAQSTLDEQLDVIKAQEQKEAEERAQRAAALKEAKMASARSIEEGRAAHNDFLQEQYALLAASKQSTGTQYDNKASSSSVSHCCSSSSYESVFPKQV